MYGSTFFCRSLSLRIPIIIILLACSKFLLTFAPNALHMRKILTWLALFSSTIALAQTDWKPASPQLLTDWAAKVDPQKPLNEYPRPQMTRDNWTNLNGLWDYAIIPASAPDALPATMDGKILVPFAIESALSGVGKLVGKDNVLWYKTTISLPAKRKGKWLLHFGAVDWKADIYINGQKLATHQGGYDPFSIDISSALIKGTSQEIAVKVWDPSDDGPQPRGKQVKRPHSIWYTPVTGIWQTVWLENVPVSYISSLEITPNLDKELVSVKVNTVDMLPGDEILVSAWHEQKIIGSGNKNGDEFTILIPEPKTWSPENPFLYDLKVQLFRKGKPVDEVGSYFAMRKISLVKDANGVQRMALNNKFTFQFGPLDQGWWPDGLYTAPTDEALAFDIEQTKAMGFNMIRKHVKVEPARWYYHADKLGMLVWQDMPSGDLGGNIWMTRPATVTAQPLDKKRSDESVTIYKKEWENIIHALKNFPCIVVWVPFNEAWGQFDTKAIADWTHQLDPSRLVIAASGGNYINEAGHILDLHNYPDPVMPDPVVFGSNQALVLGEYGGLGLPLEGHTWQQKDNWGYQSFKNAEELTKRYGQMIDEIAVLIPLGLSAAVYTQTTDVEVETNGLMTYDRKIVKTGVERIKKMNSKLFD